MYLSSTSTGSITSGNLLASPLHDTPIQEAKVGGMEASCLNLRPLLGHDRLRGMWEIEAALFVGSTTIW